MVTFYSGVDIPVFLLALLSKGERDDLTQRERNELKKELSALVNDHREGVERNVKARGKTA